MFVCFISLSIISRHLPMFTIMFFLCWCVQGDKLLLRLASSVVYSLLCATSTCLPLVESHQPVLSSLAKTLLAQDPPADLFWAEEGEYQHSHLNCILEAMVLMLILVF